ncbi:3-deoxy-D-manno-octulosonic-acid transferase [Lutibacter sp. Hel_I_33_5]|nr:3-deoxy-D-manno-octulosonic-acid transferase [Lutibacter sp. Hel_I_33_5]
MVFKASILLWIVSFFNKKIKLFVDGRKETFSKLSVLKKEDTIIWIHAASLGEFEQARPIIEKLKLKYEDYKIVVTFFSPSGYEIRKNYDLADVVCYLPLDSKSNAKKFVEKLNPKFAIFVKYEFWPNLLNELKERKIPTILVSGIIRKNQLFFKWHGGFMRKSLGAFHHFFVQNISSKELLSSINFKNVFVSGDTRFDRVSEILDQDNSLDFIANFKNNNYTVVAGSTWKEDEELLVNYINNEASKNEKFIIAPHNINPKEIENLQKQINLSSIKFTDVMSSGVETSNRQNLSSALEVTENRLKEYQVLIIDTIGLLTKIYSYANVAYVGGGLKTGLHNILEPATFGIPIVIGNQYQKFNEAVELVAKKGCISISNQEEFSVIFNKLKEDEKYRVTTGEINKNYIKNNIGATAQILNYIEEHLNKK